MFSDRNAGGKSKGCVWAPEILLRADGGASEARRRPRPPTRASRDVYDRVAADVDAAAARADAASDSHAAASAAETSAARSASHAARSAAILVRSAAISASL